MKEKEISKRELGKSILTAFVAIGASALLFGGLTQAALAAELDKAETIPTSYNTVPAPQKASVPEGYNKADYTIKQDSNYDETPSAKDLTQEEAAELGAQAVWEVLGANLDGAAIYMGYSSGTENFPRAFWTGDIRFGSARTPQEESYSFMVDAVTGERFNVSSSRHIDATVSLGLDMELAENPGEYLTLAKELAAKYNLVHGDVQSAAYNCQGYSGNDPDIAIDVTGVNGERVSLCISRYDQKLLSVGYDAERLIREPAMEKYQREIEQRLAQLPSTGTDANPQLVALP